MAQTLLAALHAWNRLSAVVDQWLRTRALTGACSRQGMPVAMNDAVFSGR